MTKVISQETSKCGDLAFTGPFSASPIRGFFVNAILTPVVFHDLTAQILPCVSQPFLQL